MSDSAELTRDHFRIGDHVLLTTDADGVVGGFLCEFAPEDGVMLQVTHETRVREFVLSDKAQWEIVLAVRMTPEWKQRLILALVGKLQGVRLKGEELRRLSAENVAESLRREHERVGPMGLVELDVPVLTQYSFGSYTKMRLTADHNIMVSVSNLDAELQQEVKKTKTKEDKAEKPEEGDNASE